MNASTGIQHEGFTAWVKDKGVKITGVEPAKFPGRGLGIVARRRIEVTEIQSLDPLSSG